MDVADAFSLYDLHLAITPDGMKHIIWQQQDGFYKAEVMVVTVE